MVIGHAYFKRVNLNAHQLFPVLLFWLSGLPERVAGHGNHDRCFPPQVSPSDPGVVCRLVSVHPLHVCLWYHELPRLADSKRQRVRHTRTFTVSTVLAWWCWRLRCCSTGWPPFETTARGWSCCRKKHLWSDSCSQVRWAMCLRGHRTFWDPSSRFCLTSQLATSSSWQHSRSEVMEMMTTKVWSFVDSLPKPRIYVQYKSLQRLMVDCFQIFNTILSDSAQPSSGVVW